jgi:PKD repeat protein
MTYSKILFVILLSILFFSACEKEPMVSFTVNKTEAVIGEDLEFTNETIDGLTYNWDFGDGTSSNYIHPKHHYEEVGTYEVTLTAYSESGKKHDMASKTISVKIVSKIQIASTTYPIIKGFIDYNGKYSDSEMYLYNLQLMDHNLRITDGQVFGTGNLIFLNLASSVPLDLPSGDYTFSYNHEDFTFDQCFILIGYSLKADETPYFIEEGTVTISKNGSLYTITMNLTTDHGVLVYVYYEGELQFFDSSMYGGASK